ncbi:putative oleosin [Helianthus annuus]|uniref:Oleosin n=1 Tax=Helianthus annuus TaxID=4232 RepID=A0A9K3DNJ4_HELAN|nr:oleosin-like [Helianthus annuus]KAF5758330.1 putative oleosin [Helianthus annuus]KAJ0436690.1 putative oleosin [Helianthus annuus]KAJ0440906.1 putative oleosin [Helianthus annuus]KAJ0458986.1 putative oleosin [Helianthus annuus]KAJ0639527.1 putative oleosin [Helianthus annuus]
MADRYKLTGQDPLAKQPKTIIISHGGSPIRKKRPARSPESTQLTGLMALLISTGILLVLSGATVTSAVISFIFFTPIIIITSPYWVPTGILLFFFVAMVLSVCGVGLAAAAVLVVQLLMTGGDGR